MNTYAEAIEFLYAQLPMFTRDGASAFHKDLDRTLAICESLGNPQHQFKSIHVGGTNGKGSSSHMLAAALATAGYKTGLYTSPHLVDFRERIRINGEMITERAVIDFVNTNKNLFETIKPSFFEATVGMAFQYFAAQKVDIAIIEVGLGGRLDSTNVIQPEVALITNVSMDHMNLLGDTLQEIAGEKAGIIKANTPIIISEHNSLIDSIFIAKANEVHAPIAFASDSFHVRRESRTKAGNEIDVENSTTQITYELLLDLQGSYQSKNVLGVLAVLDELNRQGNYHISNLDIKSALSQVQLLTGFQGRWQTISQDPLLICDTGHNEDGIKEVIKNLQTIPYSRLHFVIGAMKDKDLSHILPLLPNDAIYYFSAPDMPRAMPATELKDIALTYGLQGNAYASVMDAVEAAKSAYQPSELIFVGGSNFVVAELLSA
ncbi:bifunctional folylpolyglutamate synthase/dihydrofolate synthase [Sphingobacterium hungaricum]|uniref:Dihydrofolate synthase/folylpolyglutamate synthase n=1 Tax=Sphingobacterium hungaricum TaxID=2082723 RepID=A0A928UUL6_9SPHI|nr:folylpolyglutamate synthase/dihydrofolate synthase family protein [Sphingobacterium hungaricum]MBE8713641.1 dihydrofolate synthase [Sphingobacterium hungaricum]